MMETHRTAKTLNFEKIKPFVEVSLDFDRLVICSSLPYISRNDAHVER